MSEQQNAQIQILIENVRISYAYLYKPYVGKGDDGKETRSYKLHALMPPTHPSLQVVKNAQRAAAAVGWPGAHERVLLELAATDRLCLHDGTIYKADDPNYAGNKFVSASGKAKPRLVVTRNGANVEVGEDDPCALYSGCWANVMVAIWPQGPASKPGKWGKRINAQLMGVQFLRHDEKFGGGGRIARPDEFGIVAAEADGAVPMNPAQAGGAPGSDLI